MNNISITLHNNLCWWITCPTAWQLKPLLFQLSHMFSGGGFHTSFLENGIVWKSLSRGRVFRSFCCLGKRSGVQLLRGLDSQYLHLAVKVLFPKRNRWQVLYIVNPLWFVKEGCVLGTSKWSSKGIREKNNYFHTFILLSIHSSIHPFTYPLAHPSVHPSTRPPIWHPEQVSHIF